MKKRIYICYFLTVFMVLGFTASLMQGWIALAILLGLIMGVCLVWMCKIMESGEKWSYRKIKKHDKDIYEVKKEIQKIRESLDGKEDKKMNVDLKNVRPGKYQSNLYQKMVKERNYDDVRTEIETDTET